VMISWPPVVITMPDDFWFRSILQSFYDLPTEALVIYYDIGNLNGGCFIVQYLRGMSMCLIAYFLLLAFFLVNILFLTCVIGFRLFL